MIFFKDDKAAFFFQQPSSSDDFWKAFRPSGLGMMEWDLFAAILLFLIIASLAARIVYNMVYPSNHSSYGRLQNILMGSSLSSSSLSEDEATTQEEEYQQQLHSSWPSVPGMLPLIGNRLGSGGISSFPCKVAEWAEKYGDCYSSIITTPEISDKNSLPQHLTKIMEQNTNQDQQQIQMQLHHNNASGILECSIFGFRYLIVCHNDLAKRIVQQRPMRMVKSGKVSKAAKSIGVNGIFAAEGVQWQRDRRIIGPALNMKNFRGMNFLSSLQKVSQRLIRKWKEDIRIQNNHHDNTAGVITINRDVACIGVDVIGLIAFNKDYNSLERPDSQEAKDVNFIFTRLLSRILSPFPIWKIPILGDFLDGVGQVKKRIKLMINGLIQEEHCRRREEKHDSSSASTTGAADGLPASPSPKSQTFLSKIIEISQTDTNHHMSIERVHGNLQTMFMAGSHTVASAMMVCLWKIGIDESHLQEELADEVLAFYTSFTADKDTCTTDVDAFLQGLPRLRSLFYEVVRHKDGPAPQIMCQAAVDFPIDSQTTILKGTRLILPLNYLGSKPDSGIPRGPEDTSPTEFCPRRWLIVDKHVQSDSNLNTKNESWRRHVVTGVIKPSTKTGIHLSSGFGCGPRICPGQNIAEIEALVMISSILREFKISIPPNHLPLKMGSKLASTPENEIRLVLDPRNRNC